MRIQKPGYVSPGILLLGSRSISMYLLMGERFALLGGGVPWEVPRLEEQLDRFQVDRSRIRYLVISHAHHDHCGAVPYLIRKYPWIQTISSEYCAHILTKDNAVALMRDLNRKTLDALKRPHFFHGISLEFRSISVDRTVRDGDRLDLGGGLSLHFFLTPGHSRCSLSAYVPEAEALFPADAIPIPERDDRRELTVTANHDYNDYIESLKKLEPLSIRLVGYEHGGAITGEDAQGIVTRGLAATLEQRERIRQRYRELNDLELLIQETAAKYQTLELFKLVPGEVMRAITTRMVKSALGWV